MTLIFLKQLMKFAVIMLKFRNLIVILIIGTSKELLTSVSVNYADSKKFVLSDNSEDFYSFLRFIMSFMLKNWYKLFMFLFAELQRSKLVCSAEKFYKVI